MEKLAAPRGTVDLYPPESTRWQALEAQVHAIARRFGYGEIRTPMFEATELFKRGVGEATDIVEKEMYTFEDRGGRSVTLRPELTAPVVRALLQANLLAEGPQRLYYIGAFFRYERPQKGRLREPHQFGVECFGYEQPEADVEVMQLAGELLRAYNVEARLEINSIGDEVCRPRYRTALLEHFGSDRDALSADSQRRIDRNVLRLLDSKAPEDQALIESAPRFEDYLCPPCAEHFRRVRELLAAVGMPYRVNPRIVRGLDYYTRTVFEFVSSALGAQNSVCGGGRYDDLVEQLGGQPTPAVGFGLGLERFLLVVDALGRHALPAADGIALIGLDGSARDYLFPLVAALRRSDASFPVTIDYAGGKVGAQLRRAERSGARAVLIAGDDEIAQRTVQARDLERRAQVTLAQGPSPDATARAVLDWYRALAPSSDVERPAV